MVEHASFDSKNHSRVSAPVVVIVQQRLPHYRVKFFQLLRDALAAEDIELRLLHGKGSSEEAKRLDAGELEWAEEISERRLRVGGSRELTWQRCSQHLADASLVIVEQASALLLNYWLIARQGWAGPRVAFWGHGINRAQHRASPLGEAAKSAIARRPHWWFAYTSSVADYIESLGYQSSRVTVVNNALDTSELVRAQGNVTTQELRDLRDDLGIHGSNVGIFSGSMYPEKRLGFLVDSAEHIHERVPDFSLIAIGAGPDQEILERASRRHGWLHYLGPKLGVARVPYFMLSNLALNPGLVGLSTLDSFAFQVPMVTVRLAFHSPEIDYLEDGQNGIVLDGNVSAEMYADRVTRLFQDQLKLTHLRMGCEKAASMYTVEMMVERFVKGIKSALVAQ